MTRCDREDEIFMDSKKWGNNIFFITYFLYIFYQILYLNSNFRLFLPSISSYFIYFIYSLFIAKIMISKFSLKSLIIFLLLIGLSLIIYICSGELKIFEFLLIIYAARDIEFLKIAKWTKVFLLSATSIVIISAVIGIIPNYIFYRDDGGIRQALGFTYVGQLNNIFLEIIFLDLFIREKENKQFNMLRILIYFFITYIIYKITDVRNIYYISLLFMILYIIKEKKKSFFERKIVQKVMIGSYLICFAISIIMSELYNPEITWQSKLNELISNRLSITHRTLQEYDITLFGNYIPMYGVSSILNGGHSWSEYSYIDNGYMQILLKYGLIIFVLISLSYTLFIKKSFKEDNIIMCIWFFVMALSSIITDSMLNIMYNCAILSLFGVLKSSKEANLQDSIVNKGEIRWN